MTNLINEKINEMVEISVKALEDKKAEEIKNAIDIAKASAANSDNGSKAIEETINRISVLADYFIIASGTNKSQIQALCDAVEEKLGRAGHPLKQMEGYDNANWVLLDFGDIIVHVFDRENRLFYDLERIWCDGKTVDIQHKTEPRF